MGVVCFLMYFLFFNTLVSLVIAGPEGAQVVNGEVSIQQSGNNTAITASDKAIINYSSFDIAQPETVRFIQPGSNASVLNRILSANPTNINGTLLANGRVFFVNPAGVYIGNGARINVNQLVASGLNISNADFINGRYNFAGGNGAVINNGDITAQQVYLIGKQVTNSGNISCPAGYVVMAAGDRVFLGEPGSDIVLDVEGTSLSESAASEVGVLNEGTVEAAGGIIALAAAGDIYSQAISNVGSLSTSVEAGKAGQIKLTAAAGEVVNTGIIEASGSEGGRIAMEGARVGQFGTIHADGASGDGGSIDLWADEVVALSPGSLTTVNAGTNGDGGEVIAYSPDSALFWPDAKIEAKGGSMSGNGGFVEVSGKKHVEVYGSVDAGANNGLVGLFFIDPYNVEITSADAFGSWDGGNPDTFTPTGTGSTILDTTLETNLGAQNVKVSTVNGAGVEDGDITINASIDYGGNNYLTLEADDDIIFGVSGAITLTGGACDLTLIAGNTTSDGGILNDNDRTVTMGTGNLRMVADAGIGSSDNPVLTANLTNVAATTQTGGIFINNSGSGNINVTSVGGTNGLTTTTSGNISVINSAGNIALAQAITTASDGTITLNAGTNAIDTGDQTVNAGAGTISLTSDSVDFGTTADAIVTTGAVTLQPSTAATSIGIGDGAGAAYQLDDAEIAAIQNGTSGITIGRSDGTGGVTINAINFNDPVTIQSPSGGSIAVNGQITGAGDASVTLDGSGATTLAADIVTAGQNITINDSVTLGEATSTTLSTGAAAAGNISITGTVNGTPAGIAEDLSLISGTGTIGVTGAVGGTDPLGTLTLQSNTGTETGAVTFSNNVAVATLTTFAQAYAVTLQGTINVIDNDTSFVNTGLTTIGNGSGDSSTFTGGLDATSAGGVSIAGIVATTDTQMDLGATTMTADSTLKSGTGAINVASMGGDFDLTLQSDVVGATGAVTFAGNVVVNDIITFAQAYAVTLQGTTNVIDSDTSFLNTGLTTIGNGSGDSSTFTGGLDATSAGGVSMAGTVATTDTQMDLGATTLTTDSTLKSGSGAINVASLGGAFTLSLQDALAASTGNVTVAGDATLTGLTTFGGAANYDVALNGGGTITNDTTFANVGAITLGDGAGDSLTFTGGLNTTSGSGTSIAGTVATTAQDMDLGATTLTADTTLSGSAIIFNSTVDGGHSLIVNDGAGTTIFKDDVGSGAALTSLTTDADGSTELWGNVTTSGAQTYNNNVTVVGDNTLRAGGNLTVGIGKSLTGDGDLTLEATGGGITANTINMSVDDHTLSLTQNNTIDMADFSVTNYENTDLVLDSTGGSAIVTGSAADDWKSITASAEDNIELHGDGDIKIGGNLDSDSGGVSIVSDNGGIYDVDSYDYGTNMGTALDNVIITGNPAAGAGVDLPFGSGKAAIVLRSSKDLILGPSAILTADGSYSPIANDDRKSVDFDKSISGGGDRIDVAIYLGNYWAALSLTGRDIEVNSLVSISNNGTMVVDAGEKVIFNSNFYKSGFNTSNRLEVVSRISNDLNEVRRFDRLPHADDPEAIRTRFEASTGHFTGAYVLRGVKAFAEVLALTDPVPLVPPRPLEPEFRGEVEGPDTEALATLLSELGIGVQPYVTEAFAGSLSTDLRLYKAAEILQELMPVLEDADGSRIAALRKAVAQFFPTLDSLSDEEMDSFSQVLEDHKGDGTEFDLAGQCIFALREYINILSTEIGWPVEKSVEFVMGRYVPRIAENDEIRIAVIQMHLQK
ncbi:beta strand repeat-containing protein [Planctomycetota bacterium]